MPQHDLDIANGSGAAVRADLNGALAALGSTMKGPNAPPAPVAGMMWVEDDNPSSTRWTVRMHDGADWIALGILDATANAFEPWATATLGAQAAWVDLASAATTDIGAAAGQAVRITGTTTITSLGTAASGVRRVLRFAGSLTLTHNASSLILPGGASITTTADDRAEAVSLGAGNWIVTQYTPATTAGMRALAGVAWAQIQRQTVTGATVVDFTLPAGFRRYQLHIDRGQVATAGHALLLRCGVGATFEGGATDYQTGSTYNTASVAGGFSGQDSGIDVSGNLRASDPRQSAIVTIDPGSATTRFQAIGHGGGVENVTPSFRAYTFFGAREADGAKDAIRILAKGGSNISGTFTLLGLPA